VKHFSVIACFLAAGESLLHHTVTWQDSLTTQAHLKKQGVRFGSDFALKFNQKPYFNTGIFLAYIRAILLPDIDTFQGRAVLAQEIAILLMAHCSDHVSDDVIRILTDARVCVITLHHRQLRSSRSLILPSLVFSSGVRCMNCRSMRIMRVSK
jgi:hypothetical protein